MGLFSKKKKAEPVTPQPTVVKRPMSQLTFKVAGISNYKSAIEKLAEDHENDWYTATVKEIREAMMDDEKIYQYDFNVQKVLLVDEPDNQFDKNAIKVIADGEHIGYVSKTKCKQVKEISASKEIKSIHCNLYGGKYKIVTSGTEKGETEYGASIDIFYYDD